MWWGLLAFILFVCAVVVIYHGPVAGLGTGVLISFLFPCWIDESIGLADIDLRVATSLIMLLVNLFHPARRISWRFRAGDWAVFALYFVHVASDSWHDGFAFSHFVRAFGEWSIPYIAGRLAVQTIQDWRWLTGVAVIVATLCSIAATSESLTRVNFANPVFGERPVDRTPQIMIRGGVKRAEGPTRHPIWFGMVQTLLIPWVIAAVYRSLRSDGPLWWTAMPIVSLFGILATASRGPALATLGICYLTMVFCLPKWRTILIIAGLILAGVGYFAKDAVLQQLEDWGAKKWGSASKQVNVELEGKQHRLTAMSARWLVLLAYVPAVREAGLLGYGTERTATFPVNVPLGPDAKQTVAEFWTIDCEYLLLLLRFGWAGVASFIAVCTLSAWRIANQSIFVNRDERIFPFAVAATLIAVSLTLIGEWMPHDYGFLFLWLCGVANGPRLEQATPEPERRMVRKVRRNVSRPGADRMGETEMTNID